jgi:hypothetical protein
MPLITATWRVTHAGIVLLDWDDQMNSEPALDRSFAVDRFASLGGGGRTNLGRVNVSHTATFSRVRVFENDDEARTFMEQHTVSLSDGIDDCWIEWVTTGVTNKIVGAAITGYRARCENNWFLADYTVQGGELLPAGMVPTPAGNVPWRFVTITGPPGGIQLQVQNSFGFWEIVWTYLASS